MGRKDFRISLHQGTATVSGTVPSQDTKQRVLRIVRRSPGVFEVNDELRIQEKPATTTSAVDDRELSRRTAEQIATRIPGAKAGEDWWFTGWRVEGLDNAWNIVVEADEGDVTLEGEVPRFGIARQAIEATLVVPGVHSVRSEMEIEPDYYRYGYPYAPYPPYPAFSRYGAYPYAAVPGHGPYGDPWGAFDRDHHVVPDGTGRPGRPGDGAADGFSPNWRRRGRRSALAERTVAVRRAPLTRSEPGAHASRPARRARPFGGRHARRHREPAQNRLGVRAPENSARQWADRGAARGDARPGIDEVDGAIDATRPSMTAV